MSAPETSFSGHFYVKKLLNIWTSLDIKGVDLYNNSTETVMSVGVR